MKYFAAEGQISRAPIEGGIEITREQYKDALAAMQGGKIVSIDDGLHFRDPPKPEPVPKPIVQPDDDDDERAILENLIASHAASVLSDDEAGDEIKAAAGRVLQKRAANSKERDEQ